MHKFGFFNGLDLDTLRKITKTDGDTFNLAVGTLRASKITNTVSKKHGEVAQRMWKDYEGKSEIVYITNAQRCLTMICLPSFGPK